MHIPVLLNEILSLLDLKPTDVVLDATVNGGGHAKAILPLLKKGKYVACDTDTNALARAAESLKKWADKITFVHANFRDLSDTLKTLPASPNKFLFDLGWSMNQFEDAARGFSFQTDGPLDMRYDQTTQHLTAADIVNDWGQQELTNMLTAYGEEKYAWRIAKAIIAEREIEPILTTDRLAITVSMAVPAMYRNKSTHPATKTFQALRIAVNDEFGVIETGLAAALEALPKGGRIAVITFHSTEDRIVKNIFRDAKEKYGYVLVNKKPVIASQEELSKNKRSRSAKLRVIENQT